METDLPRRRWVDDRQAALLRRIALVSAPLLVGCLAVGAWLVGVPQVPRSGQAGFAETLVQVALLVLYTVGWLVALRWTVPGATVMAVTAFGIGALSVVQYEPWKGLLLALLLYLPAGLLWLGWQRTKGWRAVTALAAVLVVLLAGYAAAGSAVFDHFYGPQTPQSTAAPLPVDRVEWVWSGALTATSARVVAALADEPDGEVRLAYAAGAEPTSTAATALGAASAADGRVVGFDVTGLQPGTEYRYAVMVDGTPDASRGRGRLRTPAEGAQSFTFAFASCARLGSNARTFETVLATDPLFFVHLGDFFYADIARDDLSAFRRSYDRQLTTAAQAALFRAVPVAYVWDDHDYGPNDADRTSPSRAAAWAAYRSFVPHYPLPLGSDEGPVAQAFTIGRVRFLVTDLRSERDPKADPDGPGKTMMGPAQLAWFERELLAANGRYPLIVWVSSVPWIDRSASPGDDWGAYADERQHIADLVAANGVQGLVMLAGDAHMVAADDGTNSDFSTSGGAGFPVLHGSPLDQRWRAKGGPYSEGVHLTTGQFGLVRVTDDGARVSLHFEGRTYDGATVLTFDWTSPAGGSTDST
jgi:phosphodiesterase/alkaline phosphatase D-like protein